MRRTVLMEDIMEPQRRFSGAGFLPAVPGVNGLCLTIYQAPAPGAYFILFHDRQAAFKGAAVASCHVFCTEDRAIITLQPSDTFLQFLRRFVVVEGNDVRLLQLYFFYQIG